VGDHRAGERFGVVVRLRVHLRLPRAASQALSSTTDPSTPALNSPHTAMLVAAPVTALLQFHPQLPALSLYYV
jgi:hypothetical protein